MADQRIFIYRPCSDYNITRCYVGTGNAANGQMKRGSVVNGFAGQYGGVGNADGRGRHFRWWREGGVVGYNGGKVSF